MVISTRVAIGKTRNCMETRRPRGGVFSLSFEFFQLPRVLTKLIPIRKNVLYFIYNITQKMWVRSNWLNAVVESLPCVLYMVILCMYCFVLYCIVINVTNTGEAYKLELLERVGNGKFFLMTYSNINAAFSHWAFKIYKMLYYKTIQGPLGNISY